MAHAKISKQHIDLGAQYLENLRKLGLHPEGMVWARDTDLNENVILLFTSVFDRIGPLAMYDLLYKAFDNRQTVKDIPPSMVYVTSPDTVLYNTIVALDQTVNVYDHVKTDIKGYGTVTGKDATTFASDGTQKFEIYGIGMYILEGKRPSKNDISRQAQYFEKNISSAAA